MTAKEFELQYSAGTYLKREVNLIRGEGAYVVDDQGNSYLDCITGIGVAILGFAHAQAVEVVFHGVVRAFALAACHQLISEGCPRPAR